MLLNLPICSLHRNSFFQSSSLGGYSIFLIHNSLFNLSRSNCVLNYQAAGKTGSLMKVSGSSYKIQHVSILKLYPNTLTSPEDSFSENLKNTIGVCPETYVRITRFQKSIHLLTSRHYDKLSDIAYRLNYADQSHFGREFRFFSGCTPKEFLESGAAHPPLRKVTSPFETVRIVEN